VSFHFITFILYSILFAVYYLFIVLTKLFTIRLLLTLSYI